MTTPKPVWQPSARQIRDSNLTAFIARARRFDPDISDYTSLYRWSVDNPARFWAEFWRFAAIQSAQDWEQVIANGDAMPGAKWFPGAQLNYAENLLRYRDDRVAIIAEAEGRPGYRLTYAELYAEVARCAALLKRLGVQKGDRVAGHMANSPEAIVALLACASMGAIWSSCSPDFGVKGELERFSQIEPKVLFAIDGYRYGGKSYNTLDNVCALVKALPSVEKVIIIPFLEEQPDLTPIPRALNYNEVADAATELVFTPLPFDHPLYILYSSGTTGKPKCIVHGAGGCLLQHMKEHQLHTDISRDDVLFFFTTCGWMMWNWLVSALASGCTIVVYDGSPFYPDHKALWRLAADTGVTVFGVSARFIATSAKFVPQPARIADLSRLRAVLSTGSPLAAEGFSYIYDKVKADILLASISGGTDIAACFVLGCPIRPVYPGEIQCRGLGMAVDVYDAAGQTTREQRGELVCTRPFPSMPLGFWPLESTDGVEDTRYLNTYFARFPGVWTHGDYAEMTPQDGIIIYGRSDAVLNPGGVRIGTAEIYRQVEKIDEVLESLCIAQQWEGDVRIVLFVMLRDGIELDADLQNRIRTTIRHNASPRHVPKKIIAVADIPKTMSGKITELAVRDIVHGREIGNRDALANPEALEYFRDLAELKT